MKLGNTSLQSGMGLSILLLIVGSAVASDPTVGLSGRIASRFLPGTELEVKPLDDRKLPLVVRIVSAEPISTGYRYEIEYVGLEAGTYDLKDYLRRKDRSSVADLPSIPVTIHSVLPPSQVTPNLLSPERTPRVGGYWVALMLGGFLWVIGLMAILFLGRKRPNASASSANPTSLAERLRPLVEKAVLGQASSSALAELERGLIAHWSRKLNLSQERPIDALLQLRSHPDAGPLLQQLEIWLHRPANANGINVGALLEPYRHLPPDALEVELKA